MLVFCCIFTFNLFARLVHRVRSSFAHELDQFICTHTYHDKRWNDSYWCIFSTSMLVYWMRMHIVWCVFINGDHPQQHSTGGYCVVVAVWLHTNRKRDLHTYVRSIEMVYINSCCIKCVCRNWMERNFNLLSHISLFDSFIIR